MIPATSFRLDGDTALWVQDRPPEYGPDDDTDFGNVYYRPCDTCHGGEAWWTAVQANPCPDCDGTGRHTLDIEVPYTHREMGCTRGEVEEVGGIWPHHTFRVHVIDVLPIVADVGPVPEGIHVRITGGGICWLAEPISGGGWRHTEITLPPDAAPGKRVVRLKVHTSENVEEPT